MKDEIKEILKYIDQFVYVDQTYNDMKLSKVDGKLILDYITNLQEENERLKEGVENITTMTVCGDKKQIKNTAQYKLDIYKSRNERAIEYINNKWKKDKYYEDIENCMPFCLYDKDDLLNILNGGDENE